MNRILATAAMVCASALVGSLVTSSLSAQTTAPTNTAAPETATPATTSPSAASPDTASPATAPAVDQNASVDQNSADQPAPATMPTLSPDVTALLAKIRTGYASVKTFQATGTSSGDLDIDGRQQKQSVNFTDSFLAPNFFRHETENQVLFGSNGSGTFAYFYDRKNYVTWPMAPGRPVIANLDMNLATLLRQSDQGLLLAISNDPAEELVRGADSVATAPDVTIDNADCPALAMRFDNADVTAIFDSQSYVLRRLNVDMTRAAKLQGAQVVKSALFTFDYAKIKINAPLTPDAFAWTPPAGATEIPSAVDPAELAGNPLPAFKCTTLDGKTFSSDQLKGSVTILDFWSTTCAPCLTELPNLDQIYQANKAAGLQAYAVNEQDDNNTIQQFVDQAKLSMPVLVDGDSSVGKLFGVESGLPITVVVGKDGNVVHAYAGTKHLQDITADVTAALKAQ
jgi:peroxiredoxin/outer membrane lipoprotein-sorting protein